MAEFNARLDSPTLFTVKIVQLLGVCLGIPLIVNRQDVYSFGNSFLVVVSFLFTFVDPGGGFLYNIRNSQLISWGLVNK